MLEFWALACLCWASCVLAECRYSSCLLPKRPQWAGDIFGLWLFFRTQKGCLFLCLCLIFVWNCRSRCRQIKRLRDTSPIILTCLPNSFASSMKLQCMWVLSFSSVCLLKFIWCLIGCPQKISGRFRNRWSLCPDDSAAFKPGKFVVLCVAFLAGGLGSVLWPIVFVNAARAEGCIPSCRDGYGEQAANKLLL